MRCPLREVIADAIRAGELHYFEPDDAVHRANLATVPRDWED
jgi:hypothetical protein